MAFCKPHSRPKTVLNYSTHVEGEVKKTTMLWTFPDFLHILDKKSFREFRTEALSDSKAIKFQLKTLFLGRNNDIIEIYYLTQAPEFLKSVLTICLIRYEERPVVIKEYHTCPGNKWQHLATLIKEKIVSTRSEYLHNDGSLRLKFQFMVINDVKVDHSCVPETQLVTDFEDLLSNGLFSDVIIKSDDGYEYKVHKAILASRSTVLKAHFEHNTTECTTNIVESHLDTEVLCNVLTYIYCDKVPRLDEIPEQLLAAADFYQLTRLKKLCEEALHKNLTVENALETLQLADLHNANTLKQLTLDFIKDGQAKLITKTEAWANLTSVDFIKRIYEYIVSDDVDEDIN